jgi:hypothetical protein
MYLFAIIKKGLEITKRQVSSVTFLLLLTLIVIQYI